MQHIAPTQCPEGDQRETDYDTVDGEWGKSQKAVEGWGAHAKHIDHLKAKLGVTLNASSDGFGTGAAALVCGACHTNTAANHVTGGDTVRSINFGDGSTIYRFGPSGLPTYNGASNTSSRDQAKSCSNVSCHFQATPVWQGY